MNCFEVHRHWIKQFFAFLFVQSSVAMQGQVSNSNFDHFTTRDGLPSDQIYNCCQDREGFLWVGTDAGVSRFDGKTFKTFNTSNGLGDNEIHEIYPDKQGRVWFLPFSGKLSYYYGGSIHHLATEALNVPSAQGSSILLAEDTKGNVYLGRTGGSSVLRLSPDGITTSTLQLSGLHRYEGVSVFYETPLHEVACITSACRLILLDGTSRDITPTRLLHQEQPLMFYLTHDLGEGRLLFSGKEGLYEFRNTKAELLIRSEKLAYHTPPGFVQVKYDAFHNLWLNHLSNNTTFYKFCNGSFQQPVTLLSHVFSITTADRENNIWFATSDGLYKTTYAKLQDRQIFETNQQLMAQKIISCARDRDSGLWLGYNDGYVSRIKNGRIRHYNVNVERNTNNRVTQLKVSSAGDILVGTDETVSIIRRKKADAYDKIRTFHTANGNLLRCAVKTIFFDSSGQAFVSEPFTRSLLKLNLENLSVDMAPDGSVPGNTRVFSRFYDRQNRLYASSINGFTVFENNHCTDLAKQDERFRARVQDYAQGSDGTIFMATYGNGLIAMKDNRFVCSMPRLNRQSVICRRIYMHHDTLYAATNCGVAILTFANQQLHLLKLVSASNGLLSSDINDLAFPGTRVVVATSHGLCWFDPNIKPAVAVTPPQLVIQSIRLDDSLYTTLPKQALSYKTRLIRINFIAPVLDKPESTLYRYRLVVSDPWLITPAGFIEFRDLKPGDYHIQIQAKKYNSGWSAPQNLQFSINTPFYSTIWFIGLVASLLLLGLFFLLHALLARNFREQLHALQKKEAVEQERNRIAADIHDDIGAELTNIAILSHILKHTTTSGKDESLEIVNKIERSSSQVITKMNDVIWTLSKSDHTLQSLVSRIRQYVATINESASINISFTAGNADYIDYPLPAEFTRHVFLISKELLQNAAKHSRASQVTLSMYLTGLHHLSISYSDNGIGFDPDTEGLSPGNGLRNMKRRMMECNGKINISSAINKGCQIKLLFPLTRLKL